MAITWKLQGGIVGSATAVSALGLSELRRTRRSLALDELTFRHVGAAVDSTGYFAYGDVITLTRDVSGTATTWFIGVITEVPREGKGAFEDVLYRAAGIWWYFEHLIFQQIWPLDPTRNSHLTSPTTYRRAIAIAGQGSDGLRQNTTAFIQDVLDYLIASGSGAVTQYTAGELPTGFDVPFVALDAPTCAEALRIISRWIPDAASWFDYTATPPKFNLVRRGAASGVSFSLTDLASVSVVPRNELLVSKLVVQFITVDASNFFVLHEDKDPSGSGTTGREWGSLVFAIDNNLLPLPTGFAANYRSALSTLQYSGTLVIEESECSQAIHPGNVVNITSGPSAWASMNAHVQEVSEDFDTGRTTVTFGPAAHIRIQDMVELLQMARRQAELSQGKLLKFGNRGAKEKTRERPSTLTGSITVAGVVPTTTEVQTAIEAAYSAASETPVIGDIVNLSVGGTFKLRVYVTLQTTTLASIFVVTFSVGSDTYYGHVTQMGIY